ncbi:ECF transporter S component [Lactobacillus sp. DCY120]|uniref:Riboflavin transporter n=1 Tax=Bombilactobacillus apium TaxID=2675299 RepID=A0A850QVE3_9LACO|nr:ECF transporter S component [Bombilactobacillus apium]NVY95754.1 ECF transporter S component [Bombilactobacillus apium]
MKFLKVASNRIVGGAVLAALATLVMLVAVPLLPGFTFLKLDLSDIVVLLAFFAYGPAVGVLVAFCKVLLAWLLTGLSLGGLVGNFAALISTLSFCGPIYWLWNKDRWHGQALVTGIISLTIMMALANYYFLLPVYMQVMGWQINMSLSHYLMWGVVPFNLIKGAINSSLFLILWQRIKA